MITIKNLTRKFEDLTAVDSISFDVDKGEIYAFLRSNGARSGVFTTILLFLGKYLFSKTEN